MLTADQQPLSGYVDLTFVQVGRVVIGSKVVGEQSQLLAQQSKIVTNPACRVEKVEK
jgi:hypothetical protein